MDFNKNKPHRKLIRLETWDYSIPWWYYVTICTKDMKCWFGDVKNGEMRLNGSGEIAKECFTDIPSHFKYSDIDYFVIMPNHVHGIIIINDSVGTRHGVSLQNNMKFGNPVKHSLPVIVNLFKGSVTKLIRRSYNPSFQWQPRFYDHIIRNEMDLHRIRAYINNNPIKWKIDEYYKRKS